MSAPVAYITRSETFSACHRLHSTHLTEAENQATFGKCNNPNGHGHNYKVEVVVKGKIDRTTGMVMNLVDIKDAMDKTIMDVLDHKNIDKDVPYFKEEVSTTENLCVYIYNSLLTYIPRDQLYEVKVYETDKNVMFYRGETVPL